MADVITFEVCGHKYRAKARDYYDGDYATELVVVFHSEDGWTFSMSESADLETIVEWVKRDLCEGRLLHPEMKMTLFEEIQQLREVYTKQDDCNDFATAHDYLDVEHTLIEKIECLTPEEIVKLLVK